MLDYLGLSPAEFELTLWKILVGIACTVPCALLGCYLILRRLSLMGDAISHAVLPGIVLAVFLSGQITSWAIVLGAVAFGVLTSILTEAINNITGIPEDASMGVVFTGLFALGVVLISQLFKHAHLDDCVLYGVFEMIPLNSIDILGIWVPRAFPTMLGMLLLTLLFIGVLWKELKIVSFDPALATAMGINASLLHYALMAMVAGVTVTAFEAVGSVLVIAMLIVPGACAHLLTDRLGRMLGLAACVAAISCIAGVVLSSQNLFNTNTAGMIAVVAGVQFGLAVLFAPRHGVAARGLRNIRLGIRIVAEDILAAIYRREEALSHDNTEAAVRLASEAQRAAGGVKGWLAYQMLRRRDQLRTGADGDMKLTSLGRQRAETIVRAHRLWESYLDQHFDLPRDHLHDPAERMEHYIGPDLQEALATELEYTKTDPHGKTIPRAGANES